MKYIGITEEGFLLLQEVKKEMPYKYGVIIDQALKNARDLNVEESDGRREKGRDDGNEKGDKGDKPGSRKN